MKQIDPGEVKYSSLSVAQASTRCYKAPQTPWGGLGHHRDPRGGLAHRLETPGQAWPRWHRRAASALKNLWQDTTAATNSRKKKAPWHEMGSLGARVEERRQLLTSLTISLTSHGYFDSWLTMRSQSRCCLPLPTIYLQIEFTLLFSHHVPKVHLLPSSLSLLLPQLLPSQHLISIPFQFPLRLFMKL